MAQPDVGTLRTRLKILMAEKQGKDGRRVTYADIGAATGIAPSTLSEFANQHVTRYDERTIASLCFFFGCQPGDVLEYVPPVQERPKKKTR